MNFFLAIKSYEVGNQLAEKIDGAAFHRWLLLFLIAGGLLMLSSGSLGQHPTNPTERKWEKQLEVGGKVVMMNNLKFVC